MLTSSSSELSSDSNRSWFASSATSAIRADFLVLSVLLAFLSAAFLALASRALAVRALAFSALDCVLLWELGPPSWKSIVSRGGAVKLRPAEN
jgi:hypothetical protein